MRRWLSRFLWLSAWSCWLWLGFGLYRELPRDLGPLVCKLPGERAAVNGFVGDTDLVALRYYEESRPAPGPQRVEVYDGWSGELLHETPLHQGFNANVPDTLSLRWGVLFRGKRSPNEDASQDRGLYALDLTTGRWREFVADGVNTFAVHPDKPWVAATEMRPAGKSRVAVFDIRTGEQVFERRLPVVGGNVAAIMFIPDRNALALRAGYSNKIQIEVLSIDGGPNQSTGVDMSLADELSASRSGRICLYQPLVGWERPEGAPSNADVYDLVENCFLSSLPASETPQPYATTGRTSREAISPSGQSILRGRPGALYRVGDGRVLWRAGQHERIFGFYDGPERPLPWETAFYVAEDWHVYWKQWFPKRRYLTYARRSLEDGSLLLRTTHVIVDRERCNAAGTLFVNLGGSLHRLPFRVNYPLLALCQAILALPLVLLWAVLRCRRKRRMKMAGTTP